MRFQKGLRMRASCVLKDLYLNSCAHTSASSKPGIKLIHLRPSSISPLRLRQKKIKEIYDLFPIPP